MERARSIASVLHGRLQRLRLPEQQPPAGWEQAAHLLGVRGQDYDVRRASRAEFEGTVRGYARAAAAPPDMGRRLDRHRQLAAQLRRPGS